MCDAVLRRRAGIVVLLPALALTQVAIARGSEMQNSNVAQEVDDLFNLLDTEDLRPATFESALPRFTTESKDIVAARVAGMSATPTPPSGRVLARLGNIRTQNNRSDLIQAFVSNLRSSDPLARKFSLFGLSDLGHPGIHDFAVRALDDNTDMVLSAAIQILLPAASKNPEIRKRLEGVYNRHKGDERFRLSMGLLESGGIGHSSPGQP
jgi:hypothetical protein